MRESPPLVFLTIDAEDSAVEVAKFLQENDYTFPVLLDVDSSVSVDYGIFGVPITFLINKEGIIQKLKIGAYKSTTEIEEDLKLIIL
ncbi:MAG: TlpA family protein disulfide reductase [Dehalococcoidia bacterium]|nr:MAG: TlpA family protein disulfide reductase [Dehalococcoidia bacterium]